MLLGCVDNEIYKYLLVHFLYTILGLERIKDVMCHHYLFADGYRDSEMRCVDVRRPLFVSITTIRMTDDTTWPSVSGLSLPFPIVLSIIFPI